MEPEQTLDLRVIPFPEGKLHTELEEDNNQLGKIKGVGMNIASLPLHTIHVLHQGVSKEL